jgi:parallel beta-helix repeat protein
LFHKYDLKGTALAPEVNAFSHMTKRLIIGTIVLAIGALFFSALSLSAGSKPKPHLRRDDLQRYVAPQGSDSHVGSATQPWATLQQAARMAAPGMTIHVAPGAYDGAVSTTVSGTPIAPIRFIAETKWGAMLRTGSASAAWTNRGDYVDIVGFDITGNGRIGILNWGSHVRIIANRVHDIPARGCTGDGGAGILNANYSGSDNEINANIVHDIGDGPVPCPRVHGIYQSSVRGRITNNISYRNQGYGIHLWHAASDVIIANNLVFNNRFGGILVGAGDSPYNEDPAHPADHITVINNVVVNNLNRYGIEELGITGPHNQYVHNLVFGNRFKDWKLQTGSQTDNLAKDPQFVRYDANGNGDYHLRAGSPAIATGLCLGAPALDIDGNPRPRNQGCDLGPYQAGTTVARKWPPLD